LESHDTPASPVGKSVEMVLVAGFGTGAGAPVTADPKVLEQVFLICFFVLRGNLSTTAVY